MPPKKQEVRSQATPLSEDILSLLRGQISKGELGAGVGPLQREAGTAARQFVSSGGGRFDLSPLLGQLEEIQRRRVSESTGDLRESFGIAGTRFGTPLATGEGRLRRELETEFGAQTGELLRTEFGAQQQRLLQGIELLQNLGQENLEPFLMLAQLGINPEVFTENPFVTALAGLAGGAQGVAAIRGGG